MALQYEIDAREKPADWNTGYFPEGTSSPNAYPSILYGTEVFEVNDALRQLAISFAQNATLNDTAKAQSYRALYASTPAYTHGSQPPSIVACDTATSDVYFSGTLLSEAFENTVSLYTNGSGTYVGHLSKIFIHIPLRHAPEPAIEIYSTLRFRYS